MTDEYDERNEYKMTDELYRCSGAPDCANEGCYYSNPHDCVEQGCSGYACTGTGGLLKCVPVEQEPKPQMMICPGIGSYGDCENCAGSLPHFQYCYNCLAHSACPSCIPYEQPKPTPLDLCHHTKTYQDCDIDCQGDCTRDKVQPVDLDAIRVRSEYELDTDWDDIVWALIDEIERLGKAEYITGLDHLRDSVPELERERDELKRNVRMYRYITSSHKYDAIKYLTQRDEAYDERNEIEAEANAVTAVYLNDALEICAALGIKWEPLDGETPDPTAVNAYPTMALEEIKRLRQDARKRTLEVVESQREKLRDQYCEAVEFKQKYRNERDELRESAKLADAEIERLRKERNLAQSLNDYYRKQFVQAKELYKKLRWELHLVRTKS